MADKKITELPVLTNADAHDSDVVPIVDVSASITTKMTLGEMKLRFQGNPGPQGDPSTVPGPQGSPGQGVPTGGTAGQVLRKNGPTDYDTGWDTLDKSDVGLANVDNTTDANKPVSTAVQAELDDLQDQIDNIDPLPAQGTHAGKFLGTNGTVASWQVVDALPAQATHAGKILSTNGTIASWITPPDGRLVVSAEQNLTNGSDITLQAVARQRVLIKASAPANNVYMPNGTIDGQEVYIEGTSNSSFPIMSDGSNLVLNGTREITDGKMIKLIWNSTKAKWIIQGV